MSPENKLAKSSSPPPPSIEEIVSDAMNEQGFLFAQAVQDSVQYAPSNRVSKTEWQYIAREYPVTASDGSQTRIDLVLKNTFHPGIYVAIECKRANPLYKRWIFFDEDRYAQHGQLHFEVIQVSQKLPNPSTTPGAAQYITTANHVIRTRPSDSRCAVFNSYLEVAIDRNKRSGHTETVEDACEQVMKGHTGLMAKIIEFNADFFLCSIPVVVTTADMFCAHFNIRNVPLKTGKLDPADLNVQPIDFCAVNYHPNDNLSIQSEHIKATPTNIPDDVAFGQRRTVFLVRGEKIEYFLSWLNSRTEGLHL